MAIKAFSNVNYSKYTKPRISVGQFLFFINDDHRKIVLIDSIGKDMFKGTIGELTTPGNNLYEKFLDRIVKKITVNTHYHYCIWLEADALRPDEKR